MTKSEIVEMGSKDIIKQIREQIKKEFPACKFSIRLERYSMGRSIHISLMSGNFKVIRNDAQINGYPVKDYYQVNNYYIDDSHILTDKGKKVMKRILDITNNYNWDNSDSQSDYFDVNFYLHLNIGKWDKPYIINGKPETIKTTYNTNKADAALAQMGL